MGTHMGREVLSCINLGLRDGRNRGIGETFELVLTTSEGNRSCLRCFNRKKHVFFVWSEEMGGWFSFGPRLIIPISSFFELSVVDYLPCVRCEPRYSFVWSTVILHLDLTKVKIRDRGSRTSRVVRVSSL